MPLLGYILGSRSWQKLKPRLQIPQKAIQKLASKIGLKRSSSIARPLEKEKTKFN